MTLQIRTHQQGRNFAVVATLTDGAHELFCSDTYSHGSDKAAIRQVREYAEREGFALSRAARCIAGMAGEFPTDRAGWEIAARAIEPKIRVSEPFDRQDGAPAEGWIRFADGSSIVWWPRKHGRAEPGNWRLSISV